MLKREKCTLKYLLGNDLQVFFKIFQLVKEVGEADKTRLAKYH